MTGAWTLPRARVGSFWWEFWCSAEGHPARALKSPEWRDALCFVHFWSPVDNNSHSLVDRHTGHNLKRYSKYLSNDERFILFIKSIWIFVGRQEEIRINIVNKDYIWSIKDSEWTNSFFFIFSYNNIITRRMYYIQGRLWTFPNFIKE